MPSVLPFATVLFCAASVLRGQITVCDLFKDLKASDGKQFSLTGELVIYDDGTTLLTSSDCDREYRFGRLLWRASVQLRSSTSVSPTELDKLKAAASEMGRLRNSGQLMTSHATVSGQLRLTDEASPFPAEFVFDAVESAAADPLPDPKDLPVLSICDLFQDLESWKGKRIAVRGQFAATSEGSWISGRCDGAFFTNGYRWPVSLSYSPPLYSPNFPPSLTELGMPNGRGRDADRWQPYTATFIGRLQLRDEYIAFCGPFGEYGTNGFDHENASTGRLLVEAIRDVENITWPPGPAAHEYVVQKCGPDLAKPPR